MPKAFGSRSKYGGNLSVVQFSQCLTTSMFWITLKGVT